MGSPARRAVAAAVAVASVAALAPSGAAARLPATGIPFLVPNDEIGGARLGARIVKAKQGWGAGGDCTDYGCSYRDLRRPELGYAQFDYEDGKNGTVTRVTISLGSRDGRVSFSSPLTKFRSPKLIALGSSARAVKKAYPAAKPPKGATPPPGVSYLSLRGRRNYTTLFELQQSRLIRVILMDGRPRG